jgi:hypothetical protein
LDHQIIDQIADDLSDRLGGADGFEELPLCAGRFESGDRHDRLGHHAARLIEPHNGREAQTLGQWPTRHGIEIADAF